jgi:hypothetical protein
MLHDAFLSESDWSTAHASAALDGERGAIA